MRSMIDLKSLLIGLGVAALLGLICHQLFNIDLAMALILAVGAIFINGMIALLADRRKLDD